MIQLNKTLSKSALTLAITVAGLSANNASAGIEHIQVYNGTYNTECASEPSSQSYYGNDSVTSSSYLMDDSGEVVFDEDGEPIIEEKYASFYKVRSFTIDIPGVLTVSTDDPKYNNLLNIEAECIDGRMQPAEREVTEVKTTLAQMCHDNLVSGVEAIDNIPGFTLYFGATADAQDILGTLPEGETGANGLNDGCEEFVDNIVETYFVEPLANVAPPVIDHFTVAWETKTFKFMWFTLFKGTQWGNEETYFTNGDHETRRRLFGWNTFQRTLYGQDFPSAMLGCQDPYQKDVDAQYFVKQADGSVNVYGQAIKAVRFFCTTPNPSDVNNREADMTFNFHFHLQQEYVGSNQ